MRESVSIKDNVSIETQNKKRVLVDTWMWIYNCKKLGQV